MKREEAASPIQELQLFRNAVEDKIRELEQIQERGRGCTPSFSSFFTIPRIKKNFAKKIKAIPSKT